MCISIKPYLVETADTFYVQTRHLGPLDCPSSEILRQEAA